jgi:hypothetical protein
MEARAIDIDDRKGEVVGLHGKGGGDREVVDRMAEELKEPIIPSSEDASRSSFRRLENEGSQGRWEKGGCKEGVMVANLVSWKHRIAGRLASIAALTSSRLRRAPRPRTFQH